MNIYYSGKVVLATRYNETEKFEKFIYLFNDSNSLIKYCTQIVNKTLNPKASLGDAQYFCKKNTWEKRVIDIFKIIYKSFV